MTSCVVVEVLSRGHVYEFACHCKHSSFAELGVVLPRQPEHFFRSVKVGVIHGGHRECLKDDPVVAHHDAGSGLDVSAERRRSDGIRNSISTDKLGTSQPLLQSLRGLFVVGEDRVLRWIGQCSRTPPETHPGQRVFAKPFNLSRHLDSVAGSYYLGKFITEHCSYRRRGWLW